MKTVETPSGKQVIVRRLDKETFMKLRTSKTISRKKANNRQDVKKVIEEQLEDMKDE